MYSSKITKDRRSQLNHASSCVISYRKKKKERKERKRSVENWRIALVLWVVVESSGDTLYRQTWGLKHADQKDTGSSRDPKRHSNESREGNTKEKRRIGPIEGPWRGGERPKKSPESAKNRPATDISTLWLGHRAAPPHHGVEEWLSPDSPRAVPRHTRKSEIFAPRTKVLCFLQLHLDNNIQPHLFSTTTTTFFTYLYILLSGTGVFIPVIALVLVPYSF